ncbi:helix-turn-helix domain-containing protein [Kitasatospora purpeofusca]|uniref:helix-turn-helix domain-containing protein n=1 Tax=Kitasatospora purpeofusca TaxID=67352 RepID=UPI0022576BD9|nr:helix-turn-helix transcriptional regulator [Kitasatospora purpeofusca]MCX4752172.1 helix-turn-helix transcriptional regulator [Kitasatospora purpeofusca]WSR31768.1 helix-turn-helix transcriptional regulator [Kitasatospora purpeofusca]
MASSPSSAAQTARQALADRLQDLRRDAGLTGRELSARCGWHPAKTTRIQKGESAPSDSDIRAWCAACGAEDRIPALIAASRSVASMYVEWKRLQRAGLQQLQETYTHSYRDSRLLRFYSSDVVPGMLQTPGYAAAILSRFADRASSPDDLEQAVAQRMLSTGAMHEGNHRIVCLVEESVLRYRIAEPAVMADQLARLLSIKALPRVSLGIIPFTAERTIWPVETFHVVDDRLVEVELVTARVRVTSPHEVGEYLETFGELQEFAAYGREAGALIASAIDALG